MKKLLVSASLLVLSAAPAFAQDSGYANTPRSPVTREDLLDRPVGPNVFANTPNYPAADTYQQNAYVVPSSPAVQQPVVAYPVRNAAPAPRVTRENDIAPAAGLNSSVTGNAAIVSDYRNRGISRSDNHPAIQGTLKLQHESGVFAGAQASTIDLKSDKDANVEAVLFGGYAGNFSTIEYNAKVSYNAYPGGDNDDLAYWEFAITGGYDFDVFYGSLTWAFSPDYINGSGPTFSYGADVSVPFPGTDFSAKGHLGYTFIDKEKKYAEDYADWSLGVWYKWANFYNTNVGLTYSDTDLSKGECVDRCGATGILTLSKEFGL